MTENLQLEFAKMEMCTTENTRMDIAHPGNDKKITPQKITKTLSLENHFYHSSLLFNTQLQSIFKTENCLILNSSLYFRQTFV